MIRIYYPKELGQNIQIGEQRHYMVNVHRLQKGDTFHLFNASGEFEYMIEMIDRDHVYCTKVSQINNVEKELKLTLALPLIKVARLEWAVEKAVELGVKKIYLISTERTVERNPDLSRLKRIICAAVQQSGRLSLPEVVGPMPLVELCMHEKDLVVCSLEGKNNIGKFEECTLVVGPEGGFSPKEQKLLSPYTQLRLVDDGILRTETAAIVGLGLMKRFM